MKKVFLGSLDWNGNGGVWEIRSRRGIISGAEATSDGETMVFIDSSSETNAKNLIISVKTINALAAGVAGHCTVDVSDPSAFTVRTWTHLGALQNADFQIHIYRMSGG